MPEKARIAGVFAALWSVVACAPGMIQSADRDVPPTPPPNVYEVSQEQAAGTQEAQAFIEVSGSAQVEVPADRAQITLAVETDDPLASQAAALNAELMTAVVDALGARDGLTLQTYGYRLQPQYTRSAGSAPRLTSYRASNFIRVTLTSVEGVGRILDLAMASGANRVAGITFDAQDTREARQTAVAQAVANARLEAETMAHALGFELGDPLEIRGGATPTNPLRNREMMTALQEAPTPIEAGSISVRANVTVKFRLGDPLR